MKQLKISSITYFIFYFFFFTSFYSCSLKTGFAIEKTINSSLNNTCTISGYILDKYSKEPLIGANILLNNGKLGASTDVNGFFSISNITPGNYNIMVEYIGYKTFSKSDLILKSNYIYDLTVELLWN